MEAKDELVRMQKVRYDKESLGAWPWRNASIRAPATRCQISSRNGNSAASGAGSAASCFYSQRLRAYHA
jgi:hypothetical protein